MPSALTIPGVQITTIFEPSPVLPSATGILGVVGVTDRGPTRPTPIGTFGEFVDTFGPGSRYTLPEVRQAFTNGVSMVVVARTQPGGPSSKASATLLDDEGEKVAKLEARAEGAWGNGISVRVTPVRTLSGQGVKYVDVAVLFGGEERESFHGLVMDPTSRNDFFRVINDQSALITAIDTTFEATPPKPLALTPLLPAPNDRPSETVLKRGADSIVRVVAKKAGPSGDRISVSVSDARAAMALPGPNDADSIRVVARADGPAGTAIKVTMSADPADASRRVLHVQAPAPAAARDIAFKTTAEAATVAAADPDVEVIALGPALPEPRAEVALGRRVNVVTRREGSDSTAYVDIAALAELTKIKDPLVTFTAVDGAKGLPEGGQATFLEGGVAAGQRMLALTGEDTGPLAAIVSTLPPERALQIRLDDAIGEDGIAGVDVTVFEGGSAIERYAALNMDPDSARYLPEVLAASPTIQGLDLFVPSRTTSLPAATERPVSLQDGASPNVDAYQDALDRLESAEEVDLVIASVLNQLDGPAIRSVHQLVVAHCTKMADVARNRIGIGSVTPDEAADPSLVLDHADDVRSDHFILATPSGSEGAIAGMLGLMEYFQSPTFKTVSALGVPAGQYTDAQLVTLIKGNVVVVNERRGLGTIVVKGVLTTSRQINVQRTANKAVRDSKAICDVYIGRLNNEGSRIALKQQILAMLAAMERVGALVPSVDGSSPAFAVNVFSTQADFANGIVNVDIAVRPVRAIDYIYGRILVQN